MYDPVLLTVYIREAVSCVTAAAKAWVLLSESISLFPDGHPCGEHVCAQHADTRSTLQST